MSDTPADTQYLLKQVVRGAGAMLATDGVTHKSDVRSVSTIQDQVEHLTNAAKVSLGTGSDPLSQEKLSENHIYQRSNKDSAYHFPSLSAIMVTLGRHGFVIVRRSAVGKEDEPLIHNSADGKLEFNRPSIKTRIVGLHFPPPTFSNIVSVSGAGDCLASGFLTGMLQGLPISKCAYVANEAASMSLQELQAVPSALDGLPGRLQTNRLAYELVLG